MRIFLRKILTRADAYNIITQCDDVEKCLTKAPERHFDINNMWKTPIPRVSTCEPVMRIRGSKSVQIDGGTL